MKLDEAVKETIDVNKKMPGKKWSIYQRFNDLVEEVGELSNAIQVKDGWKTKNRSKSPLINSLGDVLYSVLLISDYYKVDLEKEYPKVLKEIDEHREKGDFNHG